MAQRSKIKILRFLLENKAEISGREMSRSVGIDHKTCHRTLKELLDQGVVRLTETVHSNFYRLNKDHYLVKSIVNPLFESERKVLNGKGQGNGK